MENHRRVINKILIHCSDTPTGRDVRVHEIDEWHSKQWGPSKSGKYVGYHWVICIDGTIEMGRPTHEAGVHCKGQNKDSIGICLIGRGFYTKEQYNSLYYILDETCRIFGLEAKQVFGHYEFNNQKTCPILDMDLIRENLEMVLNANNKGGFNGTHS